MRTQTIYRELTAAGILLASYPIVWVAEYAGLCGAGPGAPVVLLHGLGGNRTNLLALSTYVKMAGFSNVSYFEYPRAQSVANSAENLADFVDTLDKGSGVHLVGHSLGGTIARRFAAAHPRAVRSLVTLGSPYRYDQTSPIELAIYGDEDPIVPPPLVRRLRPGAVKRAIILPKTGHLGVLYHGDTLRIVESELSSNTGRPS
jgi:pimeloyl-ACP methyl ester carboxylesterase